jgi:hypothetical protein
MHATSVAPHPLLIDNESITPHVVEEENRMKKKMKKLQYKVPQNINKAKTPHALSRVLPHG